VCLFDVVEHITDHVGFLRGIHGLMQAGGRIYLTVPAYQWLWSHEDTSAGHARRYTLETLRQALTAAGFAMEFETYFFTFLPLPILLGRVLPYRMGLSARNSTDDHRAGGGFVQRVLDAFMRRELAAIAAGRPLKMGGSCLAVARKS
jgi:hypothetical protein